MTKRTGLAPAKRKQATDIDTRGNQWQNSPKQNLFCELYLTPSKIDTFGNAYQSALKAGYSDSYSRKIATPSVTNQWLAEFVNKSVFEPEHIIQGIQTIATTGFKDSDKLRAYELLAKLQGLLVDKSIIGHVNIEQALSGLR